MNAQYFPAIDGDAVVQAAEKMIALNRDLMEKLVSHQMEVTGQALDRGLGQFKRLSEAKSVEDLVTAQHTYVEEAARRNWENTQKVLDIVNAYSVNEAHKAWFDNGDAKVATAPGGQDHPDERSREVPPDRDPGEEDLRPQVGLRLNSGVEDPT